MIHLRTLRRSRALTLLDVASLTGLPARLIAEAEYGLRALTDSERARLSLVFGLPDTALLAGPVPAQRSNTLILALPLPARHALALTALAGALAFGTLNQPAQAWMGSFAIGTVAPPRAAALTHPSTPTVEALAPPMARVALPLPPPRADTEPALLAPPVIRLTPPVELPSVAATPPPFVLTDAGPLGCPLQPAAGQAVITQGYGVGTHAPADVWGAIDLAIDSDGDGWAEPGATWQAPVVATHNGVVRATPGSWPGGNHVWVEDPASGWASGYAHLDVILVATGQEVTAGTVIGLAGSSGLATGPHLDYQVWRSGVNVDPTALVGACRR